MKKNVQLDIEIDTEKIIKDLANVKLQQEISSLVRSFNVKQMVDSRIAREVITSVNKNIQSGKFIDSVAKAVAKDVVADEVIKRIDLDAVTEKVANILANTIIQRMKSK